MIKFHIYRESDKNPSKIPQKSFKNVQISHLPTILKDSLKTPSKSPKIPLEIPNIPSEMFKNP